MSTAIVPTQRLAQLESVIHKNQQAFIAVGNALAEIRRDKLYKPEYDTFEDYLEQRWNFSRKIASDYILAAGVVSNAGVTDISLSQARELAVLEPEQQKEVADETDFKNTTKQDVRKKVQAKQMTAPAPAGGEKKSDKKAEKKLLVERGSKTLAEAFQKWAKEQEPDYSDPKSVKAAINAEIDTDVASGYLETYLKRVAAPFNSDSVVVDYVRATVKFKDDERSHGLAGDYVIQTISDIAMLFKFTKNDKGRVVEQIWDAPKAKWSRPHQDFEHYGGRRITEDIARKLAPEAFVKDNQKVA